MTPQKRKALFEDDITSTPANRQKSILETTAREQSKRKYDSCNDIDSLCYRFSKKLRCAPEKKAPRPQKASHARMNTEAKMARIKRYRDRWIPFKSPWITARVVKGYVSAEGWRRRMVRGVWCPCPERYVEGLERFCAGVGYRTRAGSSTDQSAVSPDGSESARLFEEEK